jgi:pimeloyl-ACP methyl ester carboxylesterase
MKQVYILHGWTYSLDKWQACLDLLRAHGIEATLLKVPGLTAESDKAWAIEDYVEWLNGELPKGPVLLIGHSNGGRIALNFAIAHPGRIKQLILIDSAGIYHNELPIRIKRAVFGAAAKVGKLVSSSPKLRKLLYKLAREKDYHDAPEHMRKTMANMLESDKELDITKVVTPTSIIWGDQDTVTPPKDATHIQSLLSDATVQWINDARHSPYYTHPKETAEAIVEVLS